MKFVRFWYWCLGGWRNFLLEFCAIYSPYTIVTLSYNASLGFKVALISSRLWIQLTATQENELILYDHSFTCTEPTSETLPTALIYTSPFVVSSSDAWEALGCLNCADNKWIPTISREQSLYFVVQHINHSLDTKIIVFFIAALIQGVPWVPFRFRISSWHDLYRKAPLHCSTLRSLCACESVRA